MFNPEPTATVLDWMLEIEDMAMKRDGNDRVRTPSTVHRPPSTSRTGPEKLGEILTRLFTARGWGNKQDRLRLEETWCTVVGTQTAGHTRVGSLRRGVLEVIVDSAVLLQELSNFR